MNAIIMLRFHTDAGHCRRVLALLQKLNPGVPVHGVYGGSYRDSAVERLVDHLHTQYVSPMPPTWNRVNGDLVLRAWYKQIGFAIPFDRVYYVESDLLYAQPLAEVYAHIPEDSLGLTWFGPLRKSESHWYWTSKEPWKTQWRMLLEFARAKHHYAGEPNHCLCGGAVLPRAFLEGYAGVDVPQLAHDELRMPLFAQILGIPCVDTGLLPSEESERVRVFNASKHEISEATVREELAKPDGRRVFHPYKGPLDFI